MFIAIQYKSDLLEVFWDDVVNCDNSLNVGRVEAIDVVDIDARNTKAKIIAFIFTPFLMFKEDGAEKYTILGIAVNAI
jgi:hypothetical protein